MKVEFRAAARHELFEAGQWYLQDGGPAVAEQFEWVVQSALWGHSDETAFAVRHEVIPLLVRPHHTTLKHR